MRSVQARLGMLSKGAVAVCSGRVLACSLVQSVLACEVRCGGRGAEGRWALVDAATLELCKDTLSVRKPISYGGDRIVVYPVFSPLARPPAQGTCSTPSFP